MKENPHVLNPQRGYVFSANQCITDSTYPYWYNGYFVEFRAWRIGQVLDGMQGITVDDMFGLQNDNYSWLAANSLPVMLRHLPAKLTTEESKYAEELGKWNFWLDAESTNATLFQVWWYYLYHGLWDDFLGKVPDNLLPLPETTMQLLDDTDVIKNKLMPPPPFYPSFKLALDSIHKLEKTDKALWYKAKNTSVKHLAKIPAFSYDHLKIGGWGNTVNAAKGDHGPSWKMVVELGKDINAYGIYPGGQSGNPGSKYYASFLDDWTQGKYNKLNFFPNIPEQIGSDIKYTITFHHI